MRSDWAGNPRILEGCICPISSVSHPGWRGQNGKSSSFPIMFPCKHSWGEAPAGHSSLVQADSPRAPRHLGCISLPPSPLRLPPSPNLTLHPFPPQPTSTLEVCSCLPVKSLGLQCWRTRLRDLVCMHCWAREVGVGGFAKWWPGDDRSGWCIGEAMCI